MAALSLCVSAGAWSQTANVSTASTELAVILGVDEEGTPTPSWLDVIRGFHDTDAFAEIAATRKPLSKGEQEWVDLIMRRAPAWEERVPSLLIPFSHVNAPRRVDILLGNHGGQDAFTPRDTTIVFDVNRLEQLYGSALDGASVDRIDRFFDHEFTHVLHKAWRARAALELGTPLERALWLCLKEGLGNYRSLSSRWRTDDGRLSEHAQTVLARLGPVFVERLSALAVASEDEAPALMQGLSFGPFERKWGALPVALWLSQEARGGDHLLAAWVERGPWGVLTLAKRYLPAELAARLPEVGARR